MARYYLLTRAKSPSGALFPGTLLDDVQDPVAAIVASGARTSPAPDAVLAVAAAQCEKLRRAGGSAELAEAVMLEAAARSLAQSGGGGGPRQARVVIPTRPGVDVVAVTDGVVTPTDVGILAPTVFGFVFPDPWTGGDMIFSGSDRTGAAQEEVVAYPGVAGFVAGSKVFVPAPTTARTSMPGTAGNTGSVQVANAIPVPEPTISEFVFITSLSSQENRTISGFDLANGWASVAEPIAFGDEFLVGYIV